MFKWLRKLLDNEYEKSNKRDVRSSEIYVSPPPTRNDYSSTDRTGRSASRTVQPREQMKRASSSQPSRRRNDSDSTVYTSDTPSFHIHHNSGNNNEAPAAGIKSGGGGEFGGGGASGGWGGSDGGSSGGGDGGGGGGGDCHADFAHDVIAIKLNRRARDRTLFIQ